MPFEGTKGISKEFTVAAAPDVIDDKAWMAELEKNTSWISYQRAFIGVLGATVRSSEQERAMVVLKMAEFIEQNANPAAAQKLGAQAFAFAICEEKGNMERNAFDVEFAAAGINLGPTDLEHEELQADMEEASEKLVRHLGHLNVLKDAQQHVSAEDFGVALMARMLARAKMSGFKGEADALRSKLDAEFDVKEALVNANNSGAGDYFNFKFVNEDGQPKPQPVFIIPPPGKQMIN
jgi:uncharacterized protein YycO